MIIIHFKYIKLVLDCLSENFEEKQCELDQGRGGEQNQIRLISAPKFIPRPGEPHDNFTAAKMWALYDRLQI